jgi:hypothetical protein
MAEETPPPSLTPGSVQPKPEPPSEKRFPVPWKKKLLVAIAALLVLLIGGIAACSMVKGGPNEDEMRLKDLTLIANVLESYKEQTGAYPQPTLRSEDASGVRHVWGYRPGVPAQASCTVVVGEAGNVDASLSACGGDIFSSEGKIIGWKGTVTAASAMNAIKVQRDDIPPQYPLSSFMQILPIDPAYRGAGKAADEGFGEYVYAVLAPEDGSLERGGAQYQLAATVRDSVSGEPKTFIRGTYFAPPNQHSLPASLIGPGPFVNRQGKSVSSQPYHVLMHGQAFGTPHPELGQGGDLLEKLRLQSSLQGMRAALERRQKFLAARSPLAGSEQAFSTKLDALMEEVLRMEEKYADRQADFRGFSDRAQEAAAAFAAASEDFLRAKAGEARKVLEKHQNPAALQEEISALLTAIRGSEEQLLLARDEILRYLSGEGIEEQVRARALRKVKAAQQNLDGLKEAKILFTYLTLSEQEQQALSDLLRTETSLGREQSHSAEVPEDVRVSFNGKTPAVTILSDIRLLVDELTGVLTDIATDLQVSGVLLGSVDQRFKVLLSALLEERAGIEDRLKNLAGSEDIETFLLLFDAFVDREDPSSALGLVARATSQEGDFSELSFSPQFLAAIRLLPQAGVPDLDRATRASEAQYSGIPYPLPGLNEVYATETKGSEESEEAEEFEESVEMGTGSSE